MEKIKSESEKRLIVKGNINDKSAYFLIDTGASLGLIDDNQIKKYDLVVGKPFNGSVIGAGGEIANPKRCNSFLTIGDKQISQFLLVDLENIVDSIKRETGIKILGIIGLPQMKMVGIQIDTNDNLIIIE